MGHLKFDSSTGKLVKENGNLAKCAPECMECDYCNVGGDGDSPSCDGVQPGCPTATCCTPYSFSWSASSYSNSLSGCTTFDLGGTDHQIKVTTYDLTFPSMIFHPADSGCFWWSDGVDTPSNPYKFFPQGEIIFDHFQTDLVASGCPSDEKSSTWTTNPTSAQRTAASTDANYGGVYGELSKISSTQWRLRVLASFVQIYTSGSGVLDTIGQKAAAGTIFDQTITKTANRCNEDLTFDTNSLSAGWTLDISANPEINLTFAGGNNTLEVCPGW